VQRGHPFGMPVTHGLPILTKLSKPSDAGTKC